MVVTLVGGNRAVGGATTGTSFPTSMPQTTTANNLLLLVICTTGTATITDPPGGLSGWTKMGSGFGERSTIDSQLWLYAKIAAGSDAAPTITTSSSTRLRWMIEEWSGLSTTLPTTGIPNTWTMQNASGGGGATVSDTEVAEVDNEWVYAVLGGRAGSGGTVTFTWDSDLTADQNTATGSNSYFYTATGTIALATNSLVASFNVVNAQGDGMDCLGMVGFAPLVSSTLNGDSILAGAKKDNASINVILAGAKKAVATKSTILAGAKKVNA